MPAVPLFAVQAGLAAAGSLANYFSNKKALEKAKKKTPSEKAYKQRLKTEAEQGDPLLAEQKSEILGDIKQQGAQATQGAIGQSITQGLENSVIAQELRRKADLDTLKQVATVSKDLARQNAQYKRDAQTRLDTFNMQRDSMLRDLALKKTEMTGQLVSNLADTASSAFGGYQDWNTPTMSKVGDMYETRHQGKTTYSYLGTDGKPRDYKPGK